MKITRKNMGIGKGKGYFNLVPKDPYIHSLSARGVKTKKPTTNWFGQKKEKYQLTKREKKIAVANIEGAGIGFVVGSVLGGFGGMVIGVPLGTFAGNVIGKKVVGKQRGRPLKYTKKQGFIGKALSTRADRLQYNREMMRKEKGKKLNAKLDLNDFLYKDKKNVWLKAKSSTSLVTRKQPKTVYHKGIYSQNYNEKDMKDDMKEISKLKYDIKRLLYDVNQYKGEEANSHELIEITVLKNKLPHFNFLVSHTDIDATGYFKDNVLNIDFDKEENAVIQVEFLDTKNEKIGKALIEKFNKLNDLEIGESSLYVRTSQLEETSLPLEDWR